MDKRRLRAAAYAACVALAAVLLFGPGLYAALGSGADEYVSIHPAQRPTPMMGFAADSVLNVGDVKALDDFPEVGEVIAQRIIDLRETLGGYRIPEDLLLVKGIGEKTLTQIMSALTEPLTVLPPTEE